MCDETVKSYKVSNRTLLSDFVNLSFYVIHILYIIYWLFTMDRQSFFRRLDCGLFVRDLEGLEKVIYEYISRYEKERSVYTEDIIAAVSRSESDVVAALKQMMEFNHKYRIVKKLESRPSWITYSFFTVITPNMVRADI